MLNVLLTCGLALASTAQPPTQEPLPPTAALPFNCAEAVFELFYSYDLTEFEKWTVEPGEDHGLFIKQGWLSVEYEWASKPASGPALRMSRPYNLNCSRYDRLLFTFGAPLETELTLTIHTDKGTVTYQRVVEEADTLEWSVDLEGARHISGMTISMTPGKDGPGAGWLNWIGLQSTERLPDYLAQWDLSDAQWEAHLVPKDYSPEFKPKYGIFLTEEELAALRAEHEAALKETGTSTWQEQALATHELEPEPGIYEFHKRNKRPYEKDVPEMPGSERMALAALVAKDPVALRQAARYALCLATIQHWDSDFTGHVPTCPTDTRAFRKSYTSSDLAYLMDLAGEMFTETGRIYLVRRLSEAGIGPTNYVLWRHDYVYRCNQFAFFNTGRMYAYLVMEREYARVKPYTDVALQETFLNLSTVILPDGGCLEGPSYFGATARESYKALRHYARARDVELDTVVPDCLRNTSNMIALLSSTTEEDTIPICDADADFHMDTVEDMVELMPASHWTNLLNKKRAAAGLEPVTPPGPPMPAFIHLPDMGPLASTRKLDGELVKVFVMGHHILADHTHEDKGQFVLEFAGESFAFDLGSCSYSDPVMPLYKHCQRHNMLSPVGMPDRAHPERPLTMMVKPTGEGDATSFHARIDATPGWGDYYKKWVRTWDSPTPDVLTIRDEYEIGKGDAVEFYWQTQLPVELKDNAFVITGEHGIITIPVPEGCTGRIDTMPMHDNGSHPRITIHKPGTKGVLEVTAKLEVRK